MQLKKLMDVGTSNPIVARTTVGLYPLIDIARLPDETKTGIRKASFDVMRFLVEAEKVASPLMESIRSVERRMAAEGFKVQLPTGTIETPTVGGLDATRVFLKFCKQALQSVAVAMGAMLGMSFNGPHFQRVLRRAREVWSPNHMVVKLLEADRVWLEELNDLRSEDEHPKNGKWFVEDFDIERRSDGTYLVRSPRFFNGAPVLNRLEVYSHNLLTFSEELLAHGLATFFPEPVCLLEIPVEKRNRVMPVRYRLGMKDPSH